ncbi:unnamed protein product [Cuscuta epithymum]|uniref:DUF679 domain membrane protein 2 n=1 Tax=Cuscuta epithymum TaxID=186058 RepID=A0AAV0CYL5_9ASTE|nr:unnamed protein product [Cuscuta epithymum]
MSSSRKSSIKEKTFSSLADLIRLLPTGTVFIFQFANPVLTNNGQCSAVNKWLSATFVALCGLSCGFACFTDSYTDDKGQTHYGIATRKGLWPSSGGDSDTSAYRVRLGDFFHAAVTMTVFGVLVLLDRNTVNCYYPAFVTTQNMLLMVLPPVVGAVSGTVFMLFPQRRHGIGYPESQGGSGKDTNK